MMKLPVIFRNRSEQQLPDFLMTHADALIAGTMDRETLLAQADWVIRSQAEHLLDLAENVQHAMTSVVPSEHFVKQLGLQLTASSDDALSWWHKLRQLSPRTQIAAGIGGATITAGLVLLASRSMPDALEIWRNRRTATA